ncbi:FtsX-like permease family protein [Sphaerisporangium aureirubrum]|uniref:FtsX-like permease family protein n=1 Tax=Sphaerisporangium aureirubrum TaxID=1544736 RepID=A0ABW1NH80_9ACTN
MNTLQLGLRLAFGGGREGWARLGLTALGVGLGVTLLLLSLTAQSALEGRAERSAWRDSSSATPATAPDPTLWLAVSDDHDGEPLFRLHVAPLGPNPPVPPGFDRLPRAGEVAVSPALARLLAVTPDDQLKDRFPGRVVATIGEAALAYPGQLMGVAGHTPENLRELTGAQEVRGIMTGRPGNYAYTLISRFLLAVGTVLLLLPVIVFVFMVTRIAAVRSEQRFAALRLAGATRAQSARTASVETGVGALAGTALGLAGYLTARPAVARHVTFDGFGFFDADVAVPGPWLAAVLAGVPVLAVLTAMAALLRVRITPLGIARRESRPRPTAWRALPLAAGLAGLLTAVVLRDHDVMGNDTLRGVFALSLVSTLAGSVVVGPWACSVLGDVLARRGRGATTLMAARRIADDPRAAYRGVSGVALAVYVATLLAGLAGVAGDRPGSAFRGGLRPGVVEVFVDRQPASRLAPLMTGGAVVTRLDPAWNTVVPCRELSRVVNTTCPLSPTERRRGLGGEATIGVMSGSFLESAPDLANLPVRAVYVPTDGSLAAESRVRTQAAILLPRAILNSRRDVVLRETRLWADVGTLARLVTWFAVLIAGCGLTVWVIAGLLDRRRPFALLRAAGARAGELRRVVLTETAVPLLFTVLLGLALGSFTSFVFAAVGHDPWSPPGPGFLLSLTAGVLAALAITMAALPLMDVSTREDTVRSE